MQITAVTGEEDESEEDKANQEFVSFAAHLAGQSAVVMPGSGSNQIVVVFPQPLDVDGQQVGGVVISATSAAAVSTAPETISPSETSTPSEVTSPPAAATPPVSSNLNFNAQDAMCHLGLNSQIPESAENNHGLPLFTPLNALSQPQVIHQLNQVYEGTNPSTEPVTVPGAINVDGEGVQLADLITNAAIAEGDLQITLAEGSGDNAENQPAVIVTPISPEELSKIREARRVAQMSVGGWLLYKGRKWCDRGSWKEWKDSWVERYQNWRGGEGHTKQSAISVTCGEESINAAIAGFIFTGILAVAADRAVVAYSGSSIDI